ncbi:MAG: tetratricopeptide repeat protein, partial [Ignavibacteria bacterium]|nr:tetratricopeptide repeat protein [Ignavibacteria bacterium]
VKNKLTEQNLNIDIIFGSGLAEVEKITAETGKHVAQKLGMKWDSIKFNGTIGSIFMRLSEMERRFDNCDIVEKTVLRVLRNLYFAGITDDNNVIRTDWIKKASAKFELSAKEFEWAGWLKSLEEKEFLKVLPGSKVWVEDAYLEHVVKPETDELMYEIFRKAIDIFFDDYEVLQFVGETIYDHALDDPQFLEYMNLAIEAFKRELELLKGSEQVSQLKKVKYSLGRAYWNLSQSLDTLENSKAAISYYNEMLQHVSKTGEPYEYANIKMKIGDAYQFLSFVGGIKENCLNAVSAFNEAIDILSSLPKPLDLSLAYNSLGSTYSLLAESGDAVENCKRSLKAFSDARKVRDRTGHPGHGSFTKFNTANTYTYLSGFEEKEKNLTEAIRLYKEYLTFEEVRKSARNTGGTLNNMGYAYMLLAGAVNKKENLLKALDIFREALTIRTREQMPIDYTETMCNIGETYRYLSEVEDKEENLFKAKDALLEALRLEEIHKHPMTYSTIKLNLGNVLLDLADLNGAGSGGPDREKGMKHLLEASEAASGYSESHYEMIQKEIDKRRAESGR